MIHVAIADDHQMVIEGLESILSGFAHEIKVVATANTGDELINKISKTGAKVILLDISMPGMEQFKTLKRIAYDFPETNVLILTMHDDLKNIRIALEQGAKGYLLKNHSGKQLIEAIRTVAEDKDYYSKEVQEKMNQSFKKNDKKGAKSNTPLFNVKITPTEVKVLELLAEDMTNKEIADHLKVDTKTIESHKRNIRDKVNAKSEKGLVRFAVEHGYVRS
jgi:DNA-binding NarL/FixJ family response regulator